MLGHELAAPPSFDEEMTVSQLERPVDKRGPDTIESEIEATRQRLAVTIDQLVYRASPKTIARREIATMRAHFVDGQGQVRTENVIKVAGAVIGFVALMVTLRKVTK